jgi:hypothetical protein
MNYIVIIDEPNYLGGIRYIERFYKILKIIKPEISFKVITINFSLNDSILHSLNETIYINKFLYKIDKIIVRIFNYSFYSIFFAKNNTNSIFWFSNLFISNNLKHKYNVKVVNWIPDFQFLDFPKYFTFINKISRFFYFKLQLKYSDIIIVQSKVDKQRLIYLEPTYISKYHIWQFYEPKIKTTEDLTLLQHHNLPYEYFLYPHQMWKHKRHDLLLDFFTKNPNFNLVLTGQLIDVRDPEYTLKIKNLLKLNFPNIFHLGKVSTKELEVLMKNSKAILNFSEYEGWSSCVEESISFNIPLILNNLPINIEQIPDANFIDIKNKNWSSDLIKILDNLKPPSYNYEVRILNSHQQLLKIINCLL